MEELPTIDGSVKEVWICIFSGNVQHEGDDVEVDSDVEVDVEGVDDRDDAMNESSSD